MINNHYAPYLPANFKTYHEPFFGGGAMFIWAYKQNPDARFYLNDINENIIQIYETIKTDLDLFLRLVDNLESDYLSLSPPHRKVVHEIITNGKKTTRTEWVDNPSGVKDKALEKKHKLPVVRPPGCKKRKSYRHDWRTIFKERPTRRSFFFRMRQMYQEDYKQWTPTEEASILYFLMKTAFNGVWQVGAEHRRFNTPCGLMRHIDTIYDKQNVIAWNRALQNCVITSGDFAETMPNIGKDSFVFLDPPYRSDSGDGETFADYGTDLGDNFQRKVVDFFHKSRSKSAHTMLSNRDWGDGFFEELLGDANIEYFDYTYTAGRKKKQEDNTHTATKAKEILMT